MANPFAVRWHGSEKHTPLSVSCTGCSVPARVVRGVLGQLVRTFGGCFIICRDSASAGSLVRIDVGPGTTDSGETCSKGQTGTPVVVIYAVYQVPGTVEEQQEGDSEGEGEEGEGEPEERIVTGGGSILFSLRRSSLPAACRETCTPAPQYLRRLLL